MQRAVSNQTISGYLLPTVMWPRVEYQQANRAAAAALGVQGPMLRAAAVQEGFETNALFLTDELLRTWTRAGNSRDVFWPTNDMSQWLLKRFVARSGNEWFVMGLVYPATNGVSGAALAELSSRLEEKKVLLSSWGLLGGVTLAACAEPHVAGGDADDCAGPGFVVAGFSPAGGSAAGAGRPAVEQSLPAGHDVFGGLVVESAQPDGGAPDIGHGHRLQHFHATGFAAARRRPRSGSPFHWTRSAAVRRNRHCRVWVFGVVGQCGHGQLGQGLCGRHRRKHVDCRLSASGLVELPAKKTSNRTPRANRLLPQDFIRPQCGGWV